MNDLLPGLPGDSPFSFNATSGHWNPLNLALESGICLTVKENNKTATFLGNMGWRTCLSREGQMKYSDAKDRDY